MKVTPTGLVCAVVLAAPGCEAGLEPISSPVYLDAAGVAPSAAQVDMQRERTEVLATDRAYAAASANTNVIEGLTAMLDLDVVFILGPQHVIGVQAVRAALEGNPANLTLVQTWFPLRADVSSDGQHGYTYGYVEIRRPDGVVLPGKYISYWRRQADGSWKVAAYKRGGRPAGTVSLEPPPGFESPTYTHYRIFPQVSMTSESLRESATDLAFAELATSAGTAVAFSRYVAPDGAGFGAFAEMSFGPDQLAESYATVEAGALIWSPEIVAVAATGDLAYSTGGFEVRERQPDGSWQVVQRGKYLTVWKRQRTGEWRFVMDG